MKPKIIIEDFITIKFNLTKEEEVLLTEARAILKDMKEALKEESALEVQNFVESIEDSRTIIDEVMNEEIYFY